MTDEEQKKEAEAEKPKTATESPNDGISPREESPGTVPADPDLIARAEIIVRTEQASERLEKSNTELKKLLDRQERMEVSKLTSGKGQIVATTIPEPMTDREYARRIMKGEIPVR